MARVTNGEWTEVWRHKNNTFQKNTGITNFYVTGFPDRTKKEELREPFSRFRKVVDIYFGMKKDYQKRNFAFVRYAFINNANEMEMKLQGIRCRNKTLEVNISKHQRKVNLNQHHNQETRPRQNMQSNTTKHGASSYFMETRGNRTYAQVVNDTN